MMCLWGVFLWCSEESMLTTLPWVAIIVGFSGMMACVTAKRMAHPIEKAAESVHLLARSLFASASKATKEIDNLKALLRIPAVRGKTDTNHPWN